MEVEGAIIKAAGIIVYTVDALAKEVKYLLLKASNKPFHWTPPKGRLDPGETFKDAAFRETWEESGLRKELIEVDESFKEVLRYKAHDRDKECVYYLGKLTDPDSKITLSHEHIDHAWVSASNINEYCDKESLCNMIAHAEEHIKGKLH
ncbi:DIADENOSINE 5,5-P1,P4-TETRAPHOSPHATE PYROPHOSPHOHYDROLASE MUTT [Babesia bigemina]|uniref:Bis(5'-nucleosyl)-tetraphosphatase [asymmetrical] n=1 Tax=Babesia bigemina TaxID=5866 RepID=A0A061DBJ8_BABBI|nr:DIADENOSINE 5,5-P1,P4-TETRAPHOSPHATE PYROPHOSPHOHYDROLASE MUTT [Babesia bigemina]CDR95125.1 DIADENOSINE 5,5-P1,P4-TETRAPHOSPHATE PYROPHOSPHOHYDROLASE MUTT [Babesia bigemina]|eukprot:XP_012767311.1 DIADENOSINE 5,5-P1,P4-TETRAPHOSPHATE PYROPHOSPHOHYDROLASE MUTT [Babesia bigemina]